jgi:hypothetical protein
MEMPTFTLYSQTGGYILSAHVLEERVAQKVEDWEQAGEIVQMEADGPGLLEDQGAPIHSDAWYEADPESASDA